MTNEEQIIELLRQNQALLTKTYNSAEKTRKYFLVSSILTILTFVLPIIFLAYYLPSFIDTYMSTFNVNSLDPSYINSLNANLPDSM